MLAQCQHLLRECLSMPQKHQVNFRVTDSLLTRIKSECIKREMSLQELITASVKFYAQTPPDDWRSGTLYIHDDEEGDEQNDWMTLWQKYFREMPREKVLLMVEVMRLDLRHYHHGHGASSGGQGRSGRVRDRGFGCFRENPQGGVRAVCRRAVFDAGLSDGRDF